MLEILTALAAAVMHECGHLLVMCLAGVKAKRIRLTLAGAVIEGERIAGSRASQVAILLSGAGANLIGYLFGLGLGTEGGELFAICSLALAGVNLLPIRSLDGGEALRVIFGDSKPLRVLSLASLVCVFTASVAAIFLSGNLSLYLLAAQIFATVYLRT